MCRNQKSGQPNTLDSAETMLALYGDITDSGPQGISHESMLAKLSSLRFADMPLVLKMGIIGNLSCAEIARFRRDRNAVDSFEWTTLLQREVASARNTDPVRYALVAARLETYEVDLEEVLESLEIFIAGHAYNGARALHPFLLKLSASALAILMDIEQESRKDPRLRPVC
jgi:hypothetical protein